ARRLPPGPRRGPGRALDEARARDRRARRREGARRRRLCPPGADRRRGALRRPAHPRARLLGRGRAMSAMRILVVEDDERLAEIFRDFISELGSQPTVVGSAAAAVEALSSAAPRRARRSSWACASPRRTEPWTARAWRSRQPA